MSIETEFEQGERVDGGEFRLDEQRAREKLRNYQLPTPHYYVLEFVKAAHLMEATAFEATIGRREVEVHIDAEPPTWPELKDLYAAALGSRDEDRSRALRRLALGVNAAHGTGLGELRIEVGGEVPFAVRVGQGEIERCRPEQPPDEGMRIHLRKKLHEAMLSRFIDELGGGFKEDQLLRSRARHARVEVRSNGDVVNRGLQLAEHVRAARDYENVGEEGRVGVTWTGDGMVTRLLQHGVLIEDETREAPLSTIGVRAVVESERLKTDLSQSSFVQDASWKALHRRLVRHSYRALSEAVQRLGPTEIRKNRPLLRRLAVELFLDEQPSEPAPEVMGELKTELREMPLFDRAVADPGGRRFFSIEEARAEGLPGGLIRYSFRRFEPIPQTRPDPPVLLFPADDPAFDLDGIGDHPREEFLSSFADEVIDFTGHLEAVDRARRERRDWTSAPSFQLEARWIRTGTAGEFEVEVGVATEAAMARTGPTDHGEYLTKIFFVTDGVVVGEQSFESDAGPFRVAIRGDIPLDPLFGGTNTGARRLKPAAVEALGLMVGLIEERGMSIDLFCSLLGDFQAWINSIFQWDWIEWPNELRETPLGIAPPLTGELSDPAARLERQLERLGELARDSFVEDVVGREWSLGELHDELSSEEGPSRLVVACPGNPPEAWLKDDEDSLVVTVPQWAMMTLSTFFSAAEDYESTSILNVEPPSEDEEPAGRPHPEVERPDSDDEVELMSRMARDRHRQAEAPESAAPGERPLAPMQKDSSQEGGERAGESATRRGDDEPEWDQGIDLGEVLLGDLRRHVPSDLRSRIDEIDNIDVLEGPGQRPVHVVGDGDHLVFDLAHPAVDSAASRPEDRVARAFATTAAFEVILRYDLAHRQATWSEPLLLRLKRRFLASCTVDLA